MVRRGGWLAIVAATAIVALCGAAPAAEKQVVVYSANDDDVNDLVFTAFRKETGIEVQPVAAGSGVVFKRIQTEKDRPQGDIVWGVSRSLLTANKAYFTPYRSKNHDAIPAEYRDPDDLWIGNNIHIMAILRNTKLLSEAEAPKSWADLLDPKWKGKIAFTDPGNSGTAFTTATMLVSLWGGGDAGWDKLGKLFANLKILSKSSLVFNGVGSGEYPLAISFENPGLFWASNGSPLAVIYPSDGTVTQMEGVAIIKGGPNLETAKQFVDYINRKDVREMIAAKTFRRPARPDVDLSKVPGMVPISEVKLVTYDEAGWTEKRPATMEKLRDVIEKTR
jgi:iron(III) transport system substrate-binding protein